MASQSHSNALIISSKTIEQLENCIHIFVLAKLQFEMYASEEDKYHHREASVPP